MEKAKTSLLWAAAGYELFAKEGLEGIQVERLARILQLNKSGFYHYFADLEGFCQELIQLHRRKMDLLLSEVREIKKLDPDYLLLLVKYTSTVMFQVQITRNKDQYSFYKASRRNRKASERGCEPFVGRFFRIKCKSRARHAIL